MERNARQTSQRCPLNALGVAVNSEKVKWTVQNIQK